jgi:adenosine kinase
MKALITGSLAYDTIMVFEDQFKNHILPDQMHILNVCFFAPSMRREFGGCAGNIAYTLKLLGGDPQIMATCGEDFAPYAEWMAKHQIDQTNIKVLPGQFTAQAFITTDLDNNQISAFHPGAMNDAHLQHVSEAGDIKLGIIAPDGRQAMLDHAQQLSEANVPFIFDPGQGLPMFEGEELIQFCQQATYVVVNDYESQMMKENTGLEIQELAKMVDAFIITKGSKGSTIITQDSVLDINPATIERAEDPTGCGDAYRGGLIYGILNGLDWQTTGQIAALCGAIKIEHHGTQNHSFTFDEFAQRYHITFGQALKAA